MPLPRITRKRRFVQGLLIAAALMLPFATVSGNPYLRLDIGNMTLFLAGIPLRIDQFYLVLLVILLHDSHRPGDPPPGKIDLQLVNGDRPAASVTVSP